ncbi:hypothetical protein HID58_057637 [Brassica napus]|uniref:Uncharacterized protein n=1 Tax=Brassica napus TaxID=3708 RepID=A0ABQ8ASI9_BRANA|nr:hypothetical protein HID58_057637 [Brassica napus]
MLFALLVIATRPNRLLRRQPSSNFSGLHFLCAVRRLSSSSSTARVAAILMATESICLNPLSFARLTINPSSQFLKRRNLSCRIHRSQSGSICSKTSDYQGNIISPIQIHYLSPLNRSVECSKMLLLVLFPLFNRKITRAMQDLCVSYQQKKLTINPSSQFLKRRNLSCRIHRSQSGSICSKTSDYQGNIISPIQIHYLSPLNRSVECSKMLLLVLFPLFNRKITRAMQDLCVSYQQKK